MRITGHCLCGDITYEITGPIGPIVNCHCHRCRRWHGAAFRTRASVPVSQFHWLKGTELLSEYRSDAGNIKTFCRRCGSNLISRYEDNPDFYGVPIGGLDLDAAHAPTAHIFVQDKAPWHAISDELPQYATFPAEGANAVRGQIKTLSDE